MAGALLALVGVAASACEKNQPAPDVAPSAGEQSESDSAWNPPPDSEQPEKDSRGNNEKAQKKAARKKRARAKRKRARADSRVPTAPVPPPVKPKKAARPKPAPRASGRADTDPSNDRVVAPPVAVPDCHAKLRTAGITFQPASLPLKQVHNDIPTCGANDAVTVSKTASGMSISPPATMTCQLALGMAGLDTLVQEFAQKEFNTKVRTLHQGGTYSCRKMVRFDMVSEHSYGNAIDVFSFTLETGTKISVLNDFGSLSASSASLSAKARFLRGLGTAAYDRDYVSVSLGPFWDALHKNHFHFDMARYRVDGSRAR